MSRSRVWDGLDAFGCTVVEVAVIRIRSTGTAGKVGRLYYVVPSLSHGRGVTYPAGARPPLAFLHELGI
jgi:hypothetical protein